MVVMSGTSSMAASNATDADAEWMEFRRGFLEANLHATTVAFICCITVALSSRHLFTNVAVSKLPLAASFVWFLSSLLFGLKIYSNNAPIGLYVCGPVSWLADYATRCLVLWFTYYRTLAVWPKVGFLKYLTISMQLISLASFGYVLYVSAPNGPVATNSAQYNDGASIYTATDLFSSILDILLLGRLWVINQSLRTSTIQTQLVKPRFFHFSIVCLVSMIVLSGLMVGVFVTGNDPFWSWYTTFFSFRLFLTDVFSNLMRDSLIESHIQGGRLSDYELKRVSTANSPLQNSGGHGRVVFSRTSDSYADVDER